MRFAEEELKNLEVEHVDEHFINEGKGPDLQSDPFCVMLWSDTMQIMNLKFILVLILVNFINQN